MEQTHNIPTITSNDRLGFTLFIAIVLHAIVILSVTFTQNEDNQSKQIKPLEILLLKNKDKDTPAPDDAKFLAQSSQAGDSDEKERPAIAETAPPPAQQQYNNTAQDASTAKPTIPAKPQSSNKPSVLTTTIAEYKAAANQPDAKTQTKPSAAQLMERSQEIAQLSAQISRNMSTYAQRERHRFISSRTKEYRDAAYLAAWQKKIELIGNLNYPEKAKRLNLSGNLILDVALKADGSIEEITLRRTSGHKVLDDAAIRIVKFAAPFAPFPSALRKDTDILHITRTWQFLSNNRLQTSR